MTDLLSSIRRATFMALLATLAITVCLAGVPTAAPAQASDARAAPGGAAPHLNAYRAERGLRGVSPSRRLTAAAKGHADDMARNGFFTHRSSNGARLGQRVQAQGYRYCRVVENIAQGHPNRAAVMRAWMESPGHRANMLDPRVTEFGLARGAGDTWVLVLGRQGC